MRRAEIIKKINELYLTESEINILIEYVNKNIDMLNKYKSLYPIIGVSGNIFLKYIPTKDEYLEFEKTNRNHMDSAAINLNREKFNIN